VFKLTTASFCLFVCLLAFLNKFLLSFSFLGMLKLLVMTLGLESYNLGKLECFHKLTKDQKSLRIV